ncbi:MAG: 3-phosphoshikimate 1-carboxyvinyltransferase [Clostridia bacterium]
MLLYLGDALNFFVFILAIRKHDRFIFLNKTVLWMFLFILIGSLSSLFNFMSIGLFIWGLKNNLRFFTFFYSCIIFLKPQDIKIVDDAIKLIFWISVPLCTVEKFCVTYPPWTIVGDMIGGIFWNFSGSNLPLNVFLIVYLTKVSCDYFAKKTSTIYFSLVAVSSLYMASLAELKVFFVEFAIIIFLTAIWSKVSWKTILIFICMGLFANVFITLFIHMNGTWSAYADIFTIEGFLEYASRDSGYNGTGDLNRLTGIATVSADIFNGNIFKNLFGIGLGNAEYTNFFTSNFFSNNIGLNYQWFHDIWLFIETGMVGLISFTMIFITAYKDAKSKYIDKITTNYIRVNIVLMIVLFIYNISLRSETGGFLLYLILAIPYIYRRNID